MAIAWRDNKERYLIWEESSGGSDLSPLDFDHSNDNRHLSNDVQ